ncbi:hypothetical protein C8R44DRAFT_984252 [Mycena epipterygia]|nr:hypothetical protein C8R44DRAFT_984252 [Mycena epipterygia]
MPPLPHPITGNPMDLVARPRPEVRGAAESAQQGLDLAQDSAGNLPSAAAIAGIVIGLLIFIVFTYIAVRNWWRKRAKAKAERDAAAVAEPLTPPPEKPDTGTSQYYLVGQQEYAGGGNQPYSSYASA